MGRPQKKKTLSPKDYPWMVPVPVRESTFVPLLPEHRTFNVEVDLGSIGAFATVLKDRPESDILYADLQGMTSTRCLGSGRSGVYQDKYLKGIGRTLLATNWNFALERGHNNGALAVSSAAREWLTSCLFRARNAVDCIAPCEGVLARRLDPKIADFQEQAFQLRKERAQQRGVAVERLSALDSNFQAITVKPADFVRPSNLLWLMQNPPTARTSRGSRLLEMQVLLHHCLCMSTGENSGSSPRDIAKLFAVAFNQGLQRFQEAFKLGVLWGTIENNFALGGRFLDLECAIIFGSPMVGLLQAGTTVNSTKFGLLGLDITHYISESHQFLLSTIGTLKVHRDSNGDRLGRLFCGELVRELQKTFPSNHLFRSARRAEDWYYRMLIKELSPQPRVRKTLKKLISIRYGYDASDIFDWVEPISMDLSRSDPNVRHTALAPKGLYNPDDFKRGAQINGYLDTIQRQNSVRSLFAQLKHVDEELKRLSSMASA